MADVKNIRRRFTIEAKIVEDDRNEAYGPDTTIAELEAKVDLGTRFDRNQVIKLVTGIVEQLIVAFEGYDGPAPHSIVPLGEDEKAPG